MKRDIPAAVRQALPSPAVLAKLEKKPTRVLRLREVRARVGLGTTAIYERIKTGTFPAPIRLGDRAGAVNVAVGWLEHEVEGWLAARIAERERAGHVPNAVPARYKGAGATQPGGKG